MSEINFDELEDIRISTSKKYGYDMKLSNREKANFSIAKAFAEENLADKGFIVRGKKNGEGQLEMLILVAVPKEDADLMNGKSARFSSEKVVSLLDEAGLTTGSEDKAEFKLNKLGQRGNEIFYQVTNVPEREENQEENDSENNGDAVPQNPTPQTATVDENF